MNVFSWNIQATKGCDNRYDVSRIANHIKKKGDFDVICLQELAKNLPDLNADDQPELICKNFPDYEFVWAPGFSAPATGTKRCEFGNLTLVKPDLWLNSHVHTLPSPLVDTLQMPRTMAEVIVRSDAGQIAIFNTHLAFHAEAEQVDQMEYLTMLREQILAKGSRVKAVESWGPYSHADNVHGVILCGDLNIDSVGDVYQKYITGRQWVDCWVAQYDQGASVPTDRPPTCGCFDRDQWAQGPHVRDFFLASSNIGDKTVSVDVDVDTDASDHQPLWLEIAL